MDRGEWVAWDGRMRDASCVTRLCSSAQHSASFIFAIATRLLFTAFSTGVFAYSISYGLARRAAASIRAAFAIISAILEVSSRMKGLSRERQEMLRTLKEVVCIKDSSIALELLEENGWQLDASINSCLDRARHHEQIERNWSIRQYVSVTALVLAMMLLFLIGASAGLGVLYSPGGHGAKQSPEEHFARGKPLREENPGAEVRRPGTYSCPQGQFDGGLGQGCVECAAGHFKTAGRGLCRPCPMDTWSGIGSGRCKRHS